MLLSIRAPPVADNRSREPVLKLVQLEPGISITKSFTAARENGGRLLGSADLFRLDSAYREALNYALMVEGRMTYLADEPGVGPARSCEIANALESQLGEPAVVEIGRYMMLLMFDKTSKRGQLRVRHADGTFPGADMVAVFIEPQARGDYERFMRAGEPYKEIQHTQVPR